MMIKKHTLPITWAVGLTADTKKRLEQALHSESTIRFFDTIAQLFAVTSHQEQPCLLWLTSAALQDLALHQSPEAKHIDMLPKALLLGTQYSMQDFELATDMGIAEILRPPFAKKRLQAVVQRAIEIYSIQSDMLCMTREIILERELLQRKNDILSFLVNFFTRTAEPMHAEDILEKSFAALGGLFAIKSLNAVFWQQDNTAQHHLSLYIDAPQQSAAHDTWKLFLHEQAHTVLNTTPHISSTHTLRLNKSVSPDIFFPTDGNLLVLPISLGTEQFGILALLSDIPHSLGKDQVRALESAMHHLALAIDRSRRFSAMQVQVDFDILTGLHSRRHFETRLQDEFTRHMRYKEPLSGILLDLDQFKQINDRYGHQAGDYVLHELGKIIQASIRSADYCARYGGEEIVILLPHTEQAPALQFAERLRKRIASHCFRYNGNKLPIKASLGVTTVTKDHAIDQQRFIQQADEALYLAKASGRNCTRLVETPTAKQIA